MENIPKRIRCVPIAIAFALILFVVMPLDAIEWVHFETAVRGFPVMRDASGKRLADGNFVQWMEKDGLHVTIAYAGVSGSRMEETIVMRQRPELIQDTWQWRELEGGRPARTFAVNFASGMATASKLEKGEMKRWSETLDVERGGTFAGFGFTMAAKALRERL